VVNPDPPSPSDEPRKRLERFEVFLGTRFLTCSTYRRLPLFEDETAKAEFAASLLRARVHHGFALLAWVLMPEHFHVLLIPRLPESPVPALLNMLKSTMSRRVLAGWRGNGAPVLADLNDGRGGARFWQPGGGHDRNVRGDPAEVIRYIHENPVKRGLVTEPTEWPWSSARWYAGDRTGSTAIDDARAFRLHEAARLVARHGTLAEVFRVMKGTFGVV